MLAVVAVALNGISLLAVIVAMAIPYWVHVSESIASVSFGLWQYCYSALGQSACKALPEVADWMKAVRAFEILGTVGLLAALGLGVLKLIKKEQHLFMRIAAACSFISGAFILLGGIIFAIKWEDAAFTTQTGLSLYAGFAICFVAGVGAKITGWIYIIGARQQLIQPGFIANKY